MTELQKHLMQLLHEIDVTCDELGIAWTLYGPSAGWAIENGRFTGGCCEMHVMMPAAGALALKHALIAMNLPDRAFEDLSTNPKLAFNHLRYVDTSTTLIDGDDYVRYQTWGAAVTIHPLFAQRPSKAERFLQQGLACFNAGFEYSAFRFSGKRASALRASKRVIDVIGEAPFAKRVFALVKRDRGLEGCDSCYFEDEHGMTRKLATRYVLESQRIPFAGVQVPVPSDSNAYLKAHFEKSWNPETAERLRTANRIMVICDAGTPFEDTIRYLRKTGYDLEAAQEERFKYFRWRCDKLLYGREQVKQEYAYATLSRDRIDEYVRLQEHLPALREAAAADDVERLAELMDNYLKLTKKYYKKGLGFYVNSELFEMASRIWEHKGKTSHADEVRQLVPASCLQTDIGEFLAAYQ